MPKTHPQDHKAKSSTRWKCEIGSEKFDLPAFKFVGTFSRLRRIRNMTEVDQLFTLMEDPEVLRPRDLQRLEGALDPYLEDGASEFFAAWQENRAIDLPEMPDEVDEDENASA